jgi:hypothetical protein
MKTFILILVLLFSKMNLNSQSEYFGKIIHQNGKYGIIDKQGEIVINPEFELIYQPLKEGYFDYFVLKQNNKYAFVLNNTKGDSLFWTTSLFEYDSLYWPPLIYIQNYVIDSSESPYRYDRQFYGCIKYLKDNKIGLISFEHTFSSGGNYTDYYEIRYVKTYDAKYDKITDYPMNRSSDKISDESFITLINGKYGFLDLEYNFEIEPIFDTIPIFIYKTPRKWHVRENGKWGIVTIDEKTKSVKYNIPCMFNEQLMYVSNNIYVRKSFGDTLTFFDIENNTVYSPYINNSPIILNNDSLKMSVIKYHELGHRNYAYTKWYDDKFNYFLIEVIKKSEYFGSKSNNIYLINYAEKRVQTVFNDPNCSYYVISDTKNGLIQKTELGQTGSKITREYYNIETGELKIKIKLDRSYEFMRNNNERDFAYDSKILPCRYTEIRFWSRPFRLKRNYYYYYNHDSQKITRVKPRCAKI